ncbi:MAG: response regulator, partial [Candidatus Omnitrophica bacterium]|nr:response regulator [Candidatus Omnitrophota bacterium]
IILQNYIDYDSSGVLFTDMFGHSTAEVVTGQTETAVEPGPNVTVYDLPSDSRDMEIRQPFRHAPFEILAKEAGLMNKGADLEKLMRYWLDHTVQAVDEEGNPIRVPVEPARIMALFDEMRAISKEPEFGYPLDMEWGFTGGNKTLWIQQARPVLVGTGKEVVPLAAIPGEDKLVDIQTALGYTGSEGIQGKVVIVPDGLDAAGFAKIDEFMKEPYILVAKDIASKPVGGKARVLADPLAGGRTPHNINRLSTRIRNGDFVYASGWKMQEGLRLGLNYTTPIPDVPGVMISDAPVTVRTNGLSGVIVSEKIEYGRTYGDHRKTLRGLISGAMRHEEDEYHVTDNYTSSDTAYVYGDLKRHLAEQVIMPYIDSVDPGNVYYDDAYTVITGMMDGFGKDRRVDASERWEYVSRKLGERGAGVLARVLGDIKTEMSLPLYPARYDSRVVRLLAYIGGLGEGMAQSAESIEHGSAGVGGELGTLDVGPAFAKATAGRRGTSDVGRGGEEGFTVLYVEDNELYRSMFSRILRERLEPEGVIVKVHDKVDRSVFDLVREVKPDVIITDYPDDKGIASYLKRLRELVPESHIIMLTGVADKDECIRLGANDGVDKDLREAGKIPDDILAVRGRKSKGKRKSGSPVGRGTSDVDGAEAVGSMGKQFTVLYVEDDVDGRDTMVE